MDARAPGFAFSASILDLDAAREADRIAQAVLELVQKRLKRRGVVVGVSGGIDSGVVAALCARALGPQRVVALLMPEKESSAESLELGRRLCDHLGVQAIQEDITPLLEASGCYRRRDEALRAVIPEYGPGWKSKIVLPGVLDTDMYRVYSVVARSPDGREVKARLPPEAYLTVVASTNFKQRARKMLEYFHADRLAYAVAGTPNRLEYDQGFFVKNGDGAADIKPIAHLYKAQVYQLAAHLGLPADIRSRPPTTDTYSLPQSQEEFYFSLPYHQMDLCLWARDHDIAPAEVGRALGLDAVQVGRVFRDIDAKRAAARYLGSPPLLVDPAAADPEKADQT